jgi:hypothetical protein
MTKVENNAIYRLLIEQNQYSYKWRYARGQEASTSGVFMYFVYNKYIKILVFVRGSVNFMFWIILAAFTCC